MLGGLSVVATGALVAGAPVSAEPELTGAGLVGTGLGAADEPPDPDAAVPVLATPEFDPDAEVW